jgi:nucleoside-diphosphate-sugar epimerase
MGLDFRELYEQGLTHINVGTGSEISIEGLINLLSEIIGYKGSIKYDKSMPDGMLRKVLDVSRINRLGWEHKVDLEDGLAMTYACFVENRPHQSNA